MFRKLLIMCVPLALNACALPQARNTDADQVANIRKLALDMIPKGIEVGKLLAPNGPDSLLIEKTQEILAGNLKDPGSAQFRNVRVVARPEGKLVCGEMNAKNSLGGYVGYKPFISGFLIDLNELSKIKRNRSEDFYNRMVDAYLSGYREGCQ